MKHTICEIFLNPNGHCEGVYHSGQKLSGNVVLTFYEKQKIRSKPFAVIEILKFADISTSNWLIEIVVISDIVIQILGIGKCEWSEQRRLCHAEEIYLKTEIKISEPTSGRQHVIRTKPCLRVWFFFSKLKRIILVCRYYYNPDGCIYLSVWSWFACQLANVMRRKIWIHSLFGERKYYSPATSNTNANHCVYCDKNTQFKCIAIISGKSIIVINKVAHYLHEVFVYHGINSITTMINFNRAQQRSNNVWSFCDFHRCR